MSRRIIAAGVVLFALGLAGCNGPSGSGAAKPGAEPSSAKGTINGVSYEVRGSGDSRSVAGGDSSEFIAGTNKLQVQGGRVSANGKDYGPVKSGDSVLLDADGTLTINGEKR
jgi:hypothetical protein